MLLNEFLSQSMDSGLQVDVIYTDCSKAFDTIDHNILFTNFLKLLSEVTFLDGFLRTYVIDLKQ